MSQLDARRPSNEDAVDVLIDCHDRIRRFSTMAVQLSLAAASSLDLIKNTADHLHRYFDLALPLHVADAEESLLPRVERVAPELVVAALQKLNKEHARIDTALVELLPIWRELKHDPSRLGEYHGWLQSATKAFHSLMSNHLELEETALFPLLRRVLTPHDLAKIAQEIRGRRPRGVHV